MTVESTRSTAGVNLNTKSTRAPKELGDFTTNVRVIPISVVAVLLGVLCCFVASALLRMIAFFTNVFFYHRFSPATVSPANHTLGVWSLLVPIVGGLIVGLMARFGSERIRGHGIPEAIESILLRGSRIEPKVALLKPLSSAISIGSGGPFGAEGPIIMTGGAFGSMLGQLVHVTNAERKTLLVAGAAAGMSATFASPVAAALLAVELLLFEWKPRSFIPVALASATAAFLRVPMLGQGPLFVVPHHAVISGPKAIGACAACGLFAGVLSALLTLSVYAFEDLFHRLPIHWMWWPAIGGAVIGAGGLLCPHALGVGYDVIEQLLQGHLLGAGLVALLVVKWVIWSVSLGSGTSGGVLAPLLIMGAALGGCEAGWFPNLGAGYWQVISMGAILGGTMRSPFTGIIFVLELTHDTNLMLPLLLAVTCAHAFTVLLLKRSILTEKVSRRGFHVTREYEAEPTEIIFVREVMTEHALATPASLPPEVANAQFLAVIAFPDESLKSAVNRMAASGVTALTVMDRLDPTRALGTIDLHDLLKARVRHLKDEQHRERVLKVGRLMPSLLRSLTSPRSSS
jgi:chloride channel protein, CIC family